MRIIAGKYKGRRIICPEGKTVRPTSDMVRSATFNILNNIVDWENANALDVCCGTGAFGIEALSRGVKFAAFIDSSREAIEATRHNLAKVNEDPAHYEIYSNAVENLPAARRQFDVIYIDPPYSAGLVPKALKSLREKGWLAEKPIIIVETGEREKIIFPPEFEVRDERRYGNTKLLRIKLV